jgi:outer membrane immunogenic protein
MKKRFAISGLAAAAALAFAGSASAADMPLKAPPAAIVAYSWTGIYVGVGDGWQWQHLDWAFDPPVIGGANQAFSANRASNIFSGYVGAQWEFGHLVIGGEYTRFGSFGRNDWSQGTCGVGVFTCQGRIGDLQEAGGRLGWAGSGLIPFAQNWLLYATGGWARGTVTTNAIAPGGFVQSNPTQAVQDGWFAGVGLDLMLVKGSLVDWIAGVQYQHVDLGTAFHCQAFPCVPGPAGNVLNRDIGMTNDIIQFRTSLKFH